MDTQKMPSRSKGKMREIGHKFAEFLAHGAQTFPVTDKVPIKTGRGGNYAFSKHKRKTPGAQNTPLWDSSDCTGFGVLIGGDGLLGIDIDDELEGKRLLDLLPRLKETTFVQRETQAGTRGHYYVIAPSWPYKNHVKKESPGLDGKIHEAFSVRCGDSYLVGPESLHPSGDVYKCKRRKKPITLTSEEVSVLVAQVKPEKADVGQTDTQHHDAQDDQDSELRDYPPEFYAAIEAALGVTGYNAKGFSYLVRCPLRAHEHDHERPAAAWNKERHILKCQKCHGKDQFALARDVAAALGIDFRDYLPDRKPQEAGKASLPTSASGADFGALADGFAPTDLGNADRLIAQLGDNARFVSGFGWRFYNGRYWDASESALLDAWREMVRKMRNQAARLNDKNQRDALWAHAQRCESHRAIEAAKKLAQQDRRIVADSMDFDRAANLLCVRNGTIDLRTGKLRAHERSDMITRCLDVDYQPGATAALFLKFLNQIFDGDSELVAFMIKVLGYALTGETDAQAVFFLHGTGANGKSTLLQLLAYLMGTYSRSADVRTFMEQRGDKTRNDVARLAGARAVITGEPPTGVKLDESLIKLLTGGDLITARFLYQEEFEFRAIFKIFIACNHKPTITGSDHGIWRRVFLLPFTVTIPDEDQDRHLLDKLKAELPGILALLVKGAQTYYREGILKDKAPQAVRRATDDYRSEMDTVSDFIRTCCVTGKTCKVLAADLYGAYKQFLGDEDAMSARAFGFRLADKGFSKKRIGKGNEYRGIALKPNNTGPDGPKEEEQLEFEAMEGEATSYTEESSYTKPTSADLLAPGADVRQSEKASSVGSAENPDNFLHTQPREETSEEIYTRYISTPTIIDRFRIAMTAINLSQAEQDRLLAQLQDRPGQTFQKGDDKLWGRILSVTDGIRSDYLHALRASKNTQIHMAEIHASLGYWAEKGQKRSGETTH